uniref:Uncharacterized protein n=1 Tax=Ditylenchus dipsaci TaxID=166011 RepID=A0A915DIV9_9BILA
MYEDYFFFKEDGTLPITVLKDFGDRGAAGLTYVQNDQRHHIQSDVSRGVLLPPEGGWGQRTYSLTVTPNPYDEEYMKRAQNLLYTIEGDDCVTAVTLRYAATYRHGSHMKLQMGQQLQIYSVPCAPSLPNKTVVVEVVYIDELHDFIVLRAQTDLCIKSDEPSRGNPVTGQEYFQLGIFKGLPTYNKGVVMNEKPLKSGHLRGSAQTILGEFGGGCFTLHACIGITVRGHNDVPQILKQQSSADSLKELQMVDRYTSHTVFVPIAIIYYVIRNVSFAFTESA